MRSNIVICPTASKILEVYDQVLTSGLTYHRVPATLYGTSRDMEPICTAVGTFLEGSG